MTKSVTLHQVGFWIEGAVKGTDWYGQAGTIEMKPFEVRTPTRSNIIKNVNDSGFGMQTIDAVTVSVYTLYENGYKEFLKMLRYKIKPSEQRLVRKGI